MYEVSDEIALKACAFQANVNLRLKVDKALGEEMLRIRSEHYSMPINLPETEAAKPFFYISYDKISNDVKKAYSR